MLMKKTKQRITATLLSVIMILGMMPVSAAAEARSLPIGTSGVITAFEALGADVAIQSIPLGTSQADLELPDTLTATIRIADLDEEPVLDSEETDDIETGGSEADEIASSSDAGESVQSTVPLPVTWVSSPEYDGETAGTYIFTPALPEEITLASGVNTPTITVTLGAAAITGAVTAFDELPEDIRWQNTTAPEFPESVDGTVEGEAAEISLTWETEQEFNAEYPVRGLYVFTAVLGEGYTLADGVSAPQITVNTFALSPRGAMAELTGWDAVQDAITNAEDGAVIDLSGLSTPTYGKVYTFEVGDGKTLTLKGGDSMPTSPIENIAFVFGANNNITINNLSIKSAHDHTDTARDTAGYSPLHFTGTGNTLTLAGENTITSGQTTGYTEKYGAAVGVPEDAGLTIEDADGTSALTVTGGYMGAGIGGGLYGEGGNITISGGTITAKGSYLGAGIGGGYGGAGGNITISGGTVNAEGVSYGAGIGGGSQGAGGTIITISGGTITAKGGSYGSGIGGGPYDAGDNIITISGGTITAKGGSQGAGIGGGSDREGGNITISGGTVNAEGGIGGAGIGGGVASAGGTITIAGGIVNATGAKGSGYIGDSAGIGGGGGYAPSPGGAGGTVTVTGGSVRAIAGGDDAQAIGYGQGSTKSGSLTSDGTTPIYLNTLTRSDLANTAITNASYCGTTYGTNDVQTDDEGKLYFYLPVSTGEETVEVATDITTYVSEYTRQANDYNAATLSLGSLKRAVVEIVGAPTYTGTALEHEVTVALGITLLTQGADYTVSYTDDCTNAGTNTAKVIVTGTGDYTGKAEQAFSIAPKPVTITPTSGQSKPYGTTDPVLTFGNDGGLDTSAFTGAPAREEGSNVGIYAIAQGNLSAGSNYTLSFTPGVTFAITKAEYSGAPITTTKNVFTNLAQTGVEVDMGGVISGILGASVSGAAESSDAENIIDNISYTGNRVKFDVSRIAQENQTATINVTVSSTNYNDFTATITVKTVDKSDAGVSFSGTVPSAKTYGDGAFTLTTSAAAPGQNGTWEWESSDPAVLKVTGSGASASVEILKSGNAVITAKYESDTTLGDAITTSIMVAKAALTVQPKSFRIYAGGAMPTLEVTYSGLKNSDMSDTITRSGGTLAMEIRKTDGSPLENTNTAGSYDIVFTGSPVFAASEKYDISISQGTLTISSPGGGGGGSSDSGPSIIVTPPAADRPNTPTQGEIKVDVKVDANGIATVTVTEKAIADAYEKALAEAKKNGNTQNGITLVLTVNTGSQTVNSVTFNLPKAVQDFIISKGVVNTVVVVENREITVSMDLSAVKEVSKQAGSDVNITATRRDNSSLTGSAKTAIGSRPVFDLGVSYGNGKMVQSFGAGSVSVAIPYTLGANENAGNVQAVFVDANGKVQWLTSSVYDNVNDLLRFSTAHFSIYGVGYKQDAPTFTDIGSHWAKGDIAFVVNHGLFSGTSATKFSPNTAMTRGMFVTALGRLANADVSTYKQSSFTDVKNDAYYMGYIEWASKNGIVSGVGDNKFAPNQSITREQMAVIMAGYAKTIGYTLPKVHVENIFADNTKISVYAKEAVKQMQMAGVISGKNGNLVDPQGTATRAEVSAVLRRFVELAISSDTAQGWTINDSGKWMYYKNGKPVTGKKDIDGSTYIFDQYGVTADIPKNLRYATYTVQKGDNFWSISRKLNCTMSELERLNNKSRFSIIHPGDVLRVPERME